MFFGEYEHSIDPKGRVIIPTKLREGLGEKFIVTKGLDNCLFAYPQNEWSQLEEKLKTLPLASKDARAFVRFFFSGAAECEVDKQGRVLLPSNLREHASLGKDIVLIGVSNRVEIWSKENWEEYIQNESENVDAISEKMFELGF